MSGSFDPLLLVFLGALVGLVLIAAFVASMVAAQSRLTAAHRRFTAHLLAAQEEERAWVARELHDDVIQQVAGVSHALMEVSEHEGLPPAAIARLAQLEHRLKGVASGIRSVAHRMHPSVLDHLGLGPALDGLAEEMRKEGLRVVVTTGGAGTVLTPEQGLGLFRIAQEALRNARKHAGSASVQVHFAVGPEQVQLEVVDNGPGFDASSRAGGGIGMTSIRERARLLEGELTVESAPGQGTRVRVRVPRKGAA